MLHPRLTALLLLGLWGCDAKPARVYLSKVPLVIYDKSPATLVNPVVLDKENKVMPDAPKTFRAEPADVLSITEAGVTRCLRNGKAEVIVESGKASASASIECRIATELGVPDAIHLVLGAATAPIAFTAKAEDGAIENPPVLFSSENPDIARVEYGNARAVGVGSTLFRARLGAIERHISVDVVEPAPAGAIPSAAH
jgi:hypothetical protein